jgi:hypothetical protein
MAARAALGKAKSTALFPSPRTARKAAAAAPAAAEPPTRDVKGEHRDSNVDAPTKASQSKFDENLVKLMASDPRYKTRPCRAFDAEGFCSYVHTMHCFACCVDTQ